MAIVARFSCEMTYTDGTKGSFGAALDDHGRVSHNMKLETDIGGNHQSVIYAYINGVLHVLFDNLDGLTCNVPDSDTCKIVTSFNILFTGRVIDSPIDWLVYYTEDQEPDNDIDEGDGSIVALDNNSAWGMARGVDALNLMLGVMNMSLSTLNNVDVVLSPVADIYFDQQVYLHCVVRSSSGNPIVPTGTVKFRSVNQQSGKIFNLGTDTLVNGVASLTSHVVRPVGHYITTAVYSGDSVYSSRQSAPGREETVKVLNVL